MTETSPATAFRACSFLVEKLKSKKRISLQLPSQSTESSECKSATAMNKPTVEAKTQWKGILGTLWFKLWALSIKDLLQPYLFWSWHLLRDKGTMEWAQIKTSDPTFATSTEDLCHTCGSVVKQRHSDFCVMIVKVPSEKHCALRLNFTRLIQNKTGLLRALLKYHSAMHWCCKKKPKT